jgi:hypothetical protein
MSAFKQIIKHYYRFPLRSWLQEVEKQFLFPVRGIGADGYRVCAMLTQGFIKHKKGAAVF